MPKLGTTYELIVRLLHVEPVVWRRLLVPSGITLTKLHDALSKGRFFYITDHYEGYPAVLVRPTIEESTFRDVMEVAWRRVARRKDITEYERGR